MSKENRWAGVTRPYADSDVTRLSGSVNVEYTLAQTGAKKLWTKLPDLDYVSALGALTGNQAMQQAKAGLDSIYLSGWQVAGDANDSLEMYPDQSLYAANSVPIVVKRINNTFQRAEQLQTMEGEGDVDYFLPIVEDMESGFGGVLNAHELMKDMIEAGAAGVHLEDQLSSAKKCGHMGGKVLVPTKEMVSKLIASRLAADIMGVDTVLIARTDSLAGALLVTDADEYDEPFLTGERTDEGFFKVNAGMKQAVSRGLAYAPYCDLIWMETSLPDIGEMKEFATEIRKEFPNKMFAYNCSPSFNWKKHLSDKEIASFQVKISEMGYKFQFITLAGFHTQNIAIFELAEKYKSQGMTAYSKIQEQEFAREKDGYTSVKHQREVGTSYFDAVSNTISSGKSSTTAMEGSTESEQF